MALRFTETEKWKDDWFLSLSNDNKTIWGWLTDNCSVAGVIKSGFTNMNFFCKTSITEEEFFRVFNGRVLKIPNHDAWFIPNFLKVQNPSGLNSSKPVIISIRREIAKFGLFEMIKESLGNDYPINKELLKNDYSIIKGKGKGIIKGGPGGKDDVIEGEEMHPYLNKPMRVIREHAKNPIFPDA